MEELLTLSADIMLLMMKTPLCWMSGVWWAARPCRMSTHCVVHCSTAPRSTSWHRPAGASTGQHQLALSSTSQHRLALASTRPNLAPASNG